MKRILFLPLAIVFAVLGFMPAHAADAATVSIPWGDWIAQALAWAAAFLVALATAAKTLLPPIVRPFVSDAMISNAVHYALAKVNGAVAGKALTVPVANTVLKSALDYIVDMEPAAARKLGDTLGPLLAAKLSQLNCAPSEPVAIPRVFGAAVE